MRLDILAELNKARAERRAAVLVTDLEGGAQRLVTPTESSRTPQEQIDKALRSGKSGMVEGGRQAVPHRPCAVAASS